MKIIVAGSRTITDYNLVSRLIEESGFEISTLVSGAHWEGVDKLAEEWARNKGIPVERYPANWKLQGRSAGPIRNAFMASKVGAEGLIAIWDGISPGTLNMIKEAEANGLKVVKWNLLTLEENDGTTPS